MKAQLDPARRARATQPGTGSAQPGTGSAQSGMAAGGGKASRSEARAPRDDSSLPSRLPYLLPAEAATARPQATSKALGTFLDKVKKSFPATGAVAASVAPPRDSQWVARLGGARLQVDAEPADPLRDNPSHGRPHP